MSPGDFYGLNGKKLGTDGVPDGKAYIVYDDKEANKIANTKGDYKEAVNAKIDIPNAKGVVAATVASLARSNAATFNTTGLTLEKNQSANGGGFREAGFTGTTDANGTTTITPRADGPIADPRPLGGHAEIEGGPSSAAIKEHAHPSGEIETRAAGGGLPDPGSTSIGTGSTETSTAKFEQIPSVGDVQNALPNGTNIVVGATNKTVYFYGTEGKNNGPTGCRCIAKMSLSNFLKIGGK